MSAPDFVRHDPETPAANNLVVGSSYAIVLGVSPLVFVSLAAKSAALCFFTLGLAAVYMLVLTYFIGRKSSK